MARKRRIRSITGPRLRRRAGSNCFAKNNQKRSSPFISFCFPDPRALFIGSEWNRSRLIGVYLRETGTGGDHSVARRDTSSAEEFQ